uniref:Uncharacterized protein n=1 Tax=Bombyx mori TaxID=7091 RepID=A0A8R2HQH1_BOMMO|nr:uncharacterized protein LOC110385431 [Bombyx mori]
MNRSAFLGILSLVFERLKAVRCSGLFFLRIKGVIVRFAQDISCRGSEVLPVFITLRVRSSIYIMTSDSAAILPEDDVIINQRMLAHDLHKALIKVFLCKGSQLTQSMTSSQINNLLKEYSYRGSDLRYMSSRRRDTYSYN